MMDLNKQIAEIDGWKNIRHGGFCNSGLMGEYHKGSFNTNIIPDYLAPENLHELLRVVREQWPTVSISLVYDPLNHTWGATIGKSSGPDCEILSHALAEAIIEAQG